jgi:hypothetical protein
MFSDEGMRKDVRKRGPWKRPFREQSLQKRYCIRREVVRVLGFLRQDPGSSHVIVVIVER